MRFFTYSVPLILTCEWHSPSEDLYIELFRTTGNLSVPF